MTDSTTGDGTTGSHYARDPRVPPAHVGHLGRHRLVSGGAEGEHEAAPARDRESDPTYDDFLDHDGDARDVGAS